MTRRPALSAALASLALVACSATPVPTSPVGTPGTTVSAATPTTPAATSAVATSSPPPALKAPLAGLVDRQGVPDAKNPNAGSIGGVVVNLDWAVVEPRRGEIDTALIDAKLAEVDAFARAQGRPVRARLRIIGGLGAPDWLKDVTGRVHVDHQAAGDQGADDFSGDLPRFWGDAYGTAYADLQRRLAARYDADARLADVVISRCMTLWAEPFVRQASPGVVGPLFAAGYTVEADRACLVAQASAHDVWRQTRSTLSLNPFQVLTPDGRDSPDVAFTLQAMAECRRRLGDRCVVANNSIRSPLQDGDYQRLYAAIIAEGRPLTFQTAKKTRIGDLPATLDWAADTARACSVELPSGYQDTGFAPPARLAAAASKLAANCPSG